MGIAILHPSDERDPGPNRALWIVISLAASALILIALFAYLSKPPEVSASIIGPNLSVLDPALEKRLLMGGADSPIDLVIYMDTKADLEDGTLPKDRDERRHFVVNTLKEVATQSQMSLIKQLDFLANEGDVSSYRVLWIVNAIQVTGRASILPILSSQPGIERIVLNTPRLLLDEDYETFGLPPAGLT